MKWVEKATWLQLGRVINRAGCLHLLNGSSGSWLHASETERPGEPQGDELKAAAFTRADGAGLGKRHALSNSDCLD